MAEVHKWCIDPKQYQRHETRRGRRFAFETLDPQRTAVVVIDVVPFFVEENHYCRAIVPNIIRLTDALRDAGGVVTWVLPAASEPNDLAIEFFGEDVARMFAASGGSGEFSERLWKDFTIDERDLTVEKSASSAFFPGRCELPALLEARDIETVIITGTVTNVCCESSARDASTLGYRVVMVGDANAGADDQSHNATLHTIYRTFGDVRSTEEVLALIAAG